MQTGQLAIIAVCLLIGGCGVVSPFILPPDGLSQIIGGLSDARPYYGRVSPADLPDQPVGDFLLASCGCGEWRALVTLDDASPRASLIARFYTPADDTQSVVVTVHGDDGTNALRGVVESDKGESSGRVAIGASQLSFQATRGESHTDSADTCVLCHIGDDTIWPLPETHTTQVLIDPPNCLDCHEAG
jgi:hypothetical protein